MKKLLFVLLAAFTLQAQAATYKIDTEGAHAFVQFKIKHLGYSWLLGEFTKFDGTFDYYRKTPEKSSIQVTIDTTSLDSNHAERDKHLRGEDFLDVKKYPTATFKSTSVAMDGDKGVLKGDLTLHGVTKNISIDITKIGEGPDPWGGYRLGFEGTTTLAIEDYGIKNVLGPASANLQMNLFIEGIKQ